MKKTHSVSQKFLGRTSSNDTDSAPETTLLPVVPPSGDLRVLRSSKSSLTTLDNDGKLSPTTLQLKVAKAWGKSGRDPVILPTWMAEAPMWFDPKVATSTTGIRKVYTGKYNESDAGTQDENCAKYGKLAIEMHNPAARQGPISPHGLLRYGDLDIVVAIMRECLGRETRSIEYEAGRLLDWLGKDYNMSTSAYKLLRSSIMRLTSTQIVIYLDGAEQFLPDSEMPAPFTILVNDGRQPERGVIRGKISDYMAHDINEGKLWQLFDAKAYRQLMLTTKSGLARVIYLFLSSLRQQNSTFTCLSS